MTEDSNSTSVGKIDPDLLGLAENALEGGKVVLYADYFCPHCSRGGETHEQVFPDGSCGGCGAGGAEFERESITIDQDVLDNTILIINSTDADDDAVKVLTDIRERYPDIKTLKGDYIITHSSRGMQAENFKRIAGGCLFILVMVSDEETERKLTDLDRAEVKALSMAMESLDIDPTVVPVLTKAAESDDIPFRLLLIAGARLGEEKSSDHPGISSLDTLVNSIQVFKDRRTEARQKK